MNPVRGLEIDDAVFQSKECEIAALSDKLAGRVDIALLTDQDTSGGHELAAVGLHAEAFGVRVPSVGCTSLTFGMRHR